jgi:hypothetical protein
MTELKKDFSEKAPPPALMEPETYRALLENLLATGLGYGKTKNVGGFLLQDIKLVTETSSGKGETEKKVSVEKLYVVMDLDQYPGEQLRNLVMKDIAKNWGGKIVHERDLESPDFKGPGLWTIKQGSFEFDYLKDGEDPLSSVYKPNPEAYRVTLESSSPLTFPVQWGSFSIESGGTLAVRERDVKALADALQAIRSGKATAEEALYTTDQKGKTVSLFDIYGMEPKFLENNYDPVTLKAETKAVQAGFAAPKPGAKAPRLG